MVKKTRWKLSEVVIGNTEFHTQTRSGGKNYIENRASYWKNVSFISYLGALENAIWPPFLFLMFIFSPSVRWMNMVTDAVKQDVLCVKNTPQRRLCLLRRITPTQNFIAVIANSYKKNKPTLVWTRTRNWDPIQAMADRREVWTDLKAL